jgi:hypothetical protein
MSAAKRCSWSSRPPPGERRSQSIVLGIVEADELDAWSFVDTVGELPAGAAEPRSLPVDDSPAKGVAGPDRGRSGRHICSPGAYPVPPQPTARVRLLRRALLTPSAHAQAMSTRPMSTRPGASPASPHRPQKTPRAAMPIARPRFPAPFTASSIATPITVRRTPTAMKSHTIQTTSFVNCMATSGSKRMIATPRATRTAGRESALLSFIVS